MKHGGPLADFHEDLKGSLPAATKTSYDSNDGVLKRKDTDTQSLDEFVDAQG